VIRDLAVQGAQMLLVLALAPLLTGVVRKVKARLNRRQGASVIQPYRDLRRLLGTDAALHAVVSRQFQADHESGPAGRSDGRHDLRDQPATTREVATIPVMARVHAGRQALMKQMAVRRRQLHAAEPAAL